jgi:predicted dehydrogenase
VSDLWTRRREEGVAQIETESRTKPRPFRNNEALYADAVMISTPDFAHAYHGVEAVQAGQDAYVEKPLAHRMEMAIAIRAAVRKADRVVQIGTQRRSAANCQAASQFIRVGHVRRYRDGRDDMDREPARALAPPGCTMLSGSIGSEPVTIAIFDHPTNVGFPTYWHARGTGLSTRTRSA